ncbi:formate dehydrogenase subunit gamma [Nisaea acidiphila]|uniref:Formate dehydrogenase subunit gamma n=1 Tax=Nisaea acidiphila TaxID=1862145 RepID=A0A9J7AY75_9PROT|nr:formate dehydrogenase subunit gamma [Nisaea acidiphila]UUX52022.1 formate dehydrogenase subunit gamma [Nisaea acidiphila]
MTSSHCFGRLAGIALAVFLFAGFAAATGMALVPEAAAQQAGQVPGNTLGTSSDSDFWRQVRQGQQGQVSIPDARAGVMIQSEGDNWRAFRNGPLSLYGAWALLGILILLSLFFILRGRIKVEHGLSGKLIERFNSVERFAHWLTATSFVVLALTGLNVLYGRYALLPVIGPDAFSAITIAGKYLHNYIAFAFMVGVVMMFVLWVKHNIPNRLDLVWLAKAGGLFTKGVHPSSKKFNAGQKVIFWSVILGGVSISASGIALLFPFELHMFGKTFAVLNMFGANLPADLTVMQEMQLSQLWHSIVGLALIVIIIAHIYIGSIGMEGAFDAMGSGMVDENWAKEHHDLWVEEVQARQASAGSD